MKKTDNEFRIQFISKSSNESFARTVVSAFVSQLDPTVEEINDIKTAVSEAVTNCIVHAYPDSVGEIYISGSFTKDGTVKIRIRDTGKGIEDIKKAREPLFTTGGSDRAGLGFSVMETFTDKMNVRSAVSKGTTVTLFKRIEGKNSDN
ncbi:MAG: anti-sigma F factor [Ruminococcaceae bacterium]|jgi:stage II sporulation protein AB (anti-sigma F factor)|nr:anti-sigma F factor [Oscillospiraceae bacterium]